MKEITAAKFKEQCLSILDAVDPDGLVTTKRGKPIAKLMPIRACSADLIGSLKGKVEITGDILSTGNTWDESQPSGSKFDRSWIYKLGPAIRGLDRYPVRIRKGGVEADFTHLIQGPPRGTRSDLEKEGPFCI